MTLRFTRWRGPGGRAIPLALAGALIALPVAANDHAPAPQSAKASTQQVSVRELAAREATKAPLARTNTVRRAEQSTAKDSGSFFKSRQGAVALAVMVLGTGYAIYSSKHDRITSPAKK